MVMLQNRKGLVIRLLIVAALGLAFITVRSAVYYAQSAGIGGESAVGAHLFTDEQFVDMRPPAGTEYLASFSLFINSGRPSFWERFVRWQRVEYNDPRFNQLASWVCERGYGITKAEGVDISKYGPSEVPGASIIGRREVIVQLELRDNATELYLPDDYRPEILIELSFLGKRIVVRNTD